VKQWVQHTRIHSKKEGPVTEWINKSIVCNSTSIGSVKGSVPLFRSLSHGGSTAGPVSSADV
jgi:hypothetical protein